MSAMIRVLVAWLLLALPAWSAVPIKEVTSPGGLHAWLVEDHSIPFITLELRFRGGTSLDLPGKRGATYFMSGLLEEGAGKLDAQAFAAAREALATDFSFDAYADAVSVSARFLTANRDASVALLKSALQEPRFDPVAIARVRGQILSIIASNLKDPDSIASARLYHLAFGNHPYGTPKEGTPTSVAALTRADLVTAWKGALARDRVYVSAVGDITGPELGALLDELLGGLPAKGAPLPPRAPWKLTGGVTVVPFATPQSVALFAQKGLKRHDPDFFAAYVLNEMLGGGGFNSVLMQEVREKRGLTYGVYTSLVPMDEAELMIGRVASANGSIAEAIKVIREQWKKIAETGFSKARLDAIKLYLTGAYPLRFDGNAHIAQILVGMQLDHLPISYVSTRNARINALTTADIRRVAKRLLDPKGLRFVVVGEPKGLSSTDN